MRYLLLALASILLLGSCGKQKQHCWGCVIVFYDDYVASYRDSMICGKTKQDIAILKRQLFHGNDTTNYDYYEVNNCSRIR